MVRTLSALSDTAPHLLVVDDDRRIRDLLLRLDAEAQHQEISRAALIRLACERHLRSLERERQDAEYIAGYARIPERDDEVFAWSGVQEWPSDEWPEAPHRGS